MPFRRGKFFFDRLYGLMIVRPLERLARLLAWIDRQVVDGLVDLVGSVPLGTGRSCGRWGWA